MKILLLDARKIDQCALTADRKLDFAIVRKLCPVCLNR